MRELPMGTVTLLFTDIEGSTRLLQRLGERYVTELEECRSLLRATFFEFDGHEVDTQGDAFFVAFARASDAVAAAVAAQHALASHLWSEGVSVQVRIGLHTGEPQRSSEGYVGLDVHRAARIMSAGHGGQVLLSQTTRDLVEHALPEGVSLRDVGAHRLKDLQQPSHLFQLVIAGLPTDFPPLKTLDAYPNNLPIQPTPFLGRVQEVAAVAALLRREDVRLLTLTGPGGTGKTRMALQVAAELSEVFPDGVYFVNLAPLSDPEFVLPAIAQVLDVKEMGEHTLLDLLKAFLREKCMFLVLDNFEQVVQAALSVAELLVACPKLKIVVTSRMALHVRAEHEFAVLPLALPDLKHLPDLVVLSQYEAVALFIERGQAVKSDFQMTNATAPAVAEICVRLDGLPLAIELAATRIKLFPPHALLARLGQRLPVLTSGARDAPARQRTLRDTIAWSYLLLDAQEQRLFRRLSVFIGGCMLEAVEAVCQAPDESAAQIVDQVASLIDKSLLRQTAQEGKEPRLMMLETIREYGLEMLTTTGELEATRRAHAAYYLTLAEEAESGLRGAQQLAWVERLDREHDNLREALSWSLEPGPGEEDEQRRELGLRLGGALRYFWITYVHHNEGRTFLERALAASAGVATAGRAKALVAAADLAFGQGNMVAMRSLAEEALVLCRQLGDRAGIAFCLYLLGSFATQSGEHATAGSQLEESVAIFRELGNKERLAWSLWAMGNLDSTLGEYVRARACYEEALALFRELGHKAAIVEMLAFIGGVLFASQEDLVTARSLIDEALMLARKLDDNTWNKWMLALSLGYSAELALIQDDVATARSQAEEAMVLWREHHAPKVYFVWPLYLLAQVEARQGNYTEARRRYAEILTLAREVDDKPGLPFYLEQLAEVVAAQEEVEWAARLWGAAETLRETIGSPLQPVYRAGYERAVAAARTHFDEQAFAEAWVEGRNMRLEQVLAAPGPAAASTQISAGQPTTTTAKPSPTYPAGLTTREVEVLRLVAQGLSDARVAEQLVISPRTVNTHLTSIYNKLGVESRTAATLYAVEHQLV
jgi:predicted ATPase/class 3 adenylate cyclase/DNA-binding CsgD family transcriptional regulator